MIKFIKYNIVSFVFGAINLFCVYGFGKSNGLLTQIVDARVSAVYDQIENNNKFIDEITEVLKTHIDEEIEKNMIISNGMKTIYFKLLERNQ